MIRQALAAVLASFALVPAAKPTQGHENIEPIWSPDGTRIAFVSAGAGLTGHDVWVMWADGSRQLDLTPGAVNEGSPAWSPDGTRIAFTSQSGTALAVEIVGADGRGRLTVAPGGLPAWSPEGSTIAYAGEGGVHVVDVDGRGDRLVVHAAPAFPVRPTWSPDGRRLAFVDGSDLWTVGADGSDARRLTALPFARFAGAPEWSPDGSTIAFLVVGPFSAPDPNEVWTVHPDGTGLVRVASYGFADGAPAWAPDSRSLVVAAAKTRDADVELYRVTLPGGPILDIGNARAWEESPAFASDGRRLVFSVRYGPGYLRSDVWTLDLRTGARTNLTGTASGETVHARTVRPPNRLTLARVSAWLDRSFDRPILRVDVRVGDTKRDEVRGALVAVTVRLRSLVPLTRGVPPTDVHGYTQSAFRVPRSGAVQVGSRIRVTVSARPPGRSAVSKQLRLLVAARPPLGP